LEIKKTAAALVKLTRQLPRLLEDSIAEQTARKARIDTGNDKSAMANQETQTDDTIWETQTINTDHNAMNIEGQRAAGLDVSTQTMTAKEEEAFRKTPLISQVKEKMQAGRVATLSRRIRTQWKMSSGSCLKAILEHWW
jgi:hypothetical protein